MIPRDGAQVLCHREEDCLPHCFASRCRRAPSLWVSVPADRTLHGGITRDGKLPVAGKNGHEMDVRVNDVGVGDGVRVHVESRGSRRGFQKRLVAENVRGTGNKERQMTLGLN